MENTMTELMRMRHSAEDNTIFAVVYTIQLTLYVYDAKGTDALSAVVADGTAVKIWHDLKIYDEESIQFISTDDLWIGHSPEDLILYKEAEEAENAIRRLKEHILNKGEIKDDVFLRF